MQSLPQVYPSDLRASGQRAVEIVAGLSDDIASFSPFRQWWFILLVILSLIISALALLITLGQWHLQRVHNVKSVKPMGQIYFWDRDKTISVRILNNGLGPLIIDRIMFSKRDNIYSSIVDCVDLPAKSFMHDSSDDLVERVVFPNSHLTVFETQFEDNEGEPELNHARKQLSSITLKVEGRDMYDHKIILERDFQWFSRYTLKNAVES